MGVYSVLLYSILFYSMSYLLIKLFIFYNFYGFFLNTTVFWLLWQTNLNLLICCHQPSQSRAQTEFLGGSMLQPGVSLVCCYCFSAMLS